jgi:hypothetical protein
MRLFAAIESGKLTLSPLSLSDRKRVPAVAVSFEERAKLVDYFVGLVKAQTWDGHVMCSSSMDFASEDGWPEPDARDYMDDCVIEALERIRKEKAN